MPPPSNPFPAGHPRGGAAAGSGNPGLVGTVEGQVLEAQQETRFWGWKLLLGLLVGSIVLTLLTSYQAIAAQFSQIMVGLIIIAILLFIVGATLGSRGRAITSGIGRAGGAAARGVFGVARMGSNAARGSGGLLGRPTTPYALTLRRFRIVDLRGQTTSCVMLGEVDGDLMRQGDLVRVHGPRDRNRNLQAKRVEILDRVDLPPRSIVRPRKPAQFVAARTTDLLCKVAAAAVAAYWLAAFVLAYRSR